MSEAYKQALKELLTKIENGTLDEHFCLIQHTNGIGLNASWWDAYNDSLDNARKLHDEFLGSDWRFEYFSLSGELMIKRSRPLETIYGYSDGQPARAWTICILKALITIEEEQ